MKITCHSCGAKYTVSDDKVQGKTVKMKCRKCGATIVVGGAGASAGSAEGAGAQEVVAADGTGADLAPGSYLVNVADGDQRTMTLAEVLDAYNSSVVNADTYVWSDGMADWQPLGDNATITGALHDAASGGAPAGHDAGNGPRPSAPAAVAQGVSESARPAARKDAGRRNDLFGGGGGFSDSGGLSSSVSASPAGKRDENSVLFSLSALTAATAPSKPSSSGTGNNKEDSGLIDLKALAATAAPSSSASSPVAESAAMFPLGAPMLAPPPMMAPPMVYAGEPQKKSMTVPLVVGGIVALCAIGGVFVLLRGSPPAAATSQTTAQAAPTTAPAPTETVAAAPVTTVSAAALTSAASPSGSAVATTAGKPGPRPNPGKPGPAKPGPDTGAPKPPDVKKPPVSGKGTCGCAPGDLMCAMKCSAGK